MHLRSNLLKIEYYKRQKVYSKKFRLIKFIGYCPVGLPTYDRQWPSRQSTGPNAKKS